MSKSSVSKITRHFLSTNLGKALFAIAAFSMLIAVFSPFILSSPQCTTEVTQQQRNVSGCIVGADFGSGMGIIFGIGSAGTALVLALMLEAAWFKKLSFLAKFFLLIPVVMLFVYCLWVLVGLVNFIL